MAPWALHVAVSALAHSSCDLAVAAASLEDVELSLVPFPFAAHDVAHDALVLAVQLLGWAWVQDEAVGVGVAVAAVAHAGTLES